MKVIVQVQKDYLEKHINRRNPISAIAELVWNSLDGDADRVDLNFFENALGKIDEIRLSDNGHGISYEVAKETFEKLGDSWKKTKPSSPKGRKLHGRGGEGRFSAFTLGRYVEWESNYADKGEFKATKIVGTLENLGEFEINESTPTKKIGTVLTISNLAKTVGAVLTENGKAKIAEVFAIYLRAYDAKIYLNGVHIDPSILEDSSHVVDLPKILLANEKTTSARVTIIEWKHKVERVLNLCDENGFPLQFISTPIQAPGFNFSVYINSPLITEMNSAGTLEIGEMSPDLQAVLDKAKQVTKDYFRKRAAEKTKNIVQTWKEEKVYPFKDEPKSPVEEVERQVFDVVALHVNEYLPQFAESDVKNKMFSLQMLKSAIERSPQEAQRIIQEVLQLPKEKQEELAELLERTKLSSIINAAKLVSDRLEFLAGLDALIFHTETKSKVKERKHLHRLIAENTWIFGEEFTLTVDDQSLTQVLRKHLAELGDDRKELAPVTDLSGNTGIVDLMISKSIPQTRPTEREHLVVELKRPTQKIDAKCTSQVEKYAFAVAEDERFKGVKAKWVFWIISNDMDEHTRKKVTKQADRPDGLVHRAADQNLEIWAKTWAQVIDECNGRLTFYSKSLNYMASHDTGLDYLKQTHSRYLPEDMTSGGEPAHTKSSKTKAPDHPTPKTKQKK